ncbi:MAG TPA: radical SAM protein [Candidatus Acidoferrales bacterium]|nr:radical SAM protein [Candidatus Acidoferrales bacterium]
MKQIAISEETSSPSFSQLEARKLSCARLLEQHPSPTGTARFKFNKLTLHVASDYNVGFNYCDPKNVDKASSTQEALERVRSAAKSDPRLRVIEISGSGDALASRLTFEILAKVKEEYPHFTTCVVTNGLLLPKKLAHLKELGVNALKVTVNAVDASVGSRIYSFIRLSGRTLRGEAAFEVLSLNQLEGIRNASDAGMLVEVTAVYIPGVNTSHLEEVARTVRTLGAYGMNVESLVPAGRFATLRTPSMAEVELARRRCEEVYSSSGWVLEASPEMMACLFEEELMPMVLSR